MDREKKERPYEDLEPLDASMLWRSPVVYRKKEAEPDERKKEDVVPAYVIDALKNERKY